MGNYAGEMEDRQTRSNCLLGLIAVPKIRALKLCSQVRHDYDLATTLVRATSVVRHSCDKMAVNSNFITVTTMFMCHTVLYTRKQVAKRHTRRSYGLDRYVTCRQIQGSANALGLPGGILKF